MATYDVGDPVTGTTPQDYGFCGFCGGGHDGPCPLAAERRDNQISDEKENETMADIDVRTKMDYTTRVRRPIPKPPTPPGNETTTHGAPPQKRKPQGDEWNEAIDAACEAVRKACNEGSQMRPDIICGHCCHAISAIEALKKER